MFGKSKKNKTEDNELESYGVWVKHGASEESTQDSEVGTDDLDLGAELDLPDFDETDFSDMFKDDELSDSSDSTLSADELANITGGDTETTTIDEAGVSPDEDFDFDSFALDTEAHAEESTTEEAAEETPVENADEPAEATATDDLDLGDFGDLNLDDFEIDSPAEENKPVFEEDAATEDFSMDDSAPVFEETEVTEPAEETTEETFNISENTSEETFEFTEDTVDASTESDEVVFGEDEEISLDDFMDEGFSDESVAAGNNGYEPGKEVQPAPSSSDSEEISLDDFIDAGEFETTPDVPTPQEDTTEDEPPLEMDITFDDSADTIETEDNISAELSYDDEDEDSETEETVETESVDLDSFETTSSSDNENIETEDIDLSDFGIDSDAEETPVTQDVEGSKNKEVVVDYDLSVDNANMSAAPVVNVIPDSVDEIDEVEEIEEEVTEEPAANSGTTAVTNSLLEQIVADLSGLKNEINQLKMNLAEIKSAEPEAAAETVSEDEDLIFDNDEAENAGGFFQSDDTDDTIALSADELSNIMNTTSVVDEEPVEETSVEEPAFEETVEVETDIEPEVTENFETEIEETAIDESELADTEETTSPEDSISEDIPAFEYENESLEEPDINEIAIEDEEESEEDLPDEISIEKSDDILVESGNSDFMDSVTESSPVEEPVMEMPEEADDLTLETDDLELEETEVAGEAEEPVFEETEVVSEAEEPVFEETEVVSEAEEPVFEETVEDSFTEDEGVITVDSVLDAMETSKIEEENAIADITTDEVEFSTTDDLLPNDDENIISQEFGSSPSEELVEETVVSEEPIEEEISDTIDTTEEESSEEDVSFDTIDSISDSFGIEANAEPEETVNEEIIEDTFVEEEIIESEEPVVEETAIEEPVSEEMDFSSLDGSNNDLSESNIDYLTKKDESELDEDVNTDLKKDIKSVLLYMDQLLENLPEDKIIEFAKSDEFTTYKKLFSELGLS